MLVDLLGKHDTPAELPAAPRKSRADILANCAHGFSPDIFDGFCARNFRRFFLPKFSLDILQISCELENTCDISRYSCLDDFSPLAINTSAPVTSTPNTQLQISIRCNILHIQIVFRLCILQIKVEQNCATDIRIC